MTTDRVNYLNVGLMLASAAAAFVMPFEVFLLAYAVLGPLHYLTEISWLHDRGYFVEQKTDSLLLVMLCALMVVLSLAPDVPGMWKAEAQTGVNYFAFLGAAAMLLARRSATKLVAFALIAISFFPAQDVMVCRILFGIMLPTIIHVFVFTGAFILIGAMRGRSKSGIASLAVFALCTVSFFTYAPDSAGYHVSNYVRNSYAPFEVVNLAIVKLFHLGGVSGRDDVYRSATGLSVMRFVAFAYLYHYLNWFSKTSIIKWNNVSRTRAIGIVALWISSLAIFGYGYKTAYSALGFLSMLHVFLEFPLDHLTFAGIGRQFTAIAQRSPAPQTVLPAGSPSLHSPRVLERAISAPNSLRKQGGRRA